LPHPLQTSPSSKGRGRIEVGEGKGKSPPLYLPLQRKGRMKERER